MASALSISQTVVRLMGLFNSSATRRARSVVDWRLKGLPVRATTSQAMEATMALSRRGKGGLASSSRRVSKSVIAFGPALSPASDTVGVEAKSCGELNVGDQRVLVQDQDHLGPLSKVRGCRASRDQPSGFREKLIREIGTIVWRGSGHATAP